MQHEQQLDLLTLYSQNTGEILVENIPHREGNSIKCKSINDKVNRAYHKRKMNLTDMQIFNDSNGGFVFMYYNNLLFKKLELANISRMIYLATYIDYDTNEIVSGGGSNSGVKKTPMTKKEIKDIMKLNREAFRLFFNEVTEKNILIEKDKKFYINGMYFIKGNKLKYTEEYTRVYIDTVRSLYQSCTARQHKTLTYVFKLIPKLRYTDNLLVQNPNDENSKKMSLIDVGEYLGISTDKKNLNKFKNNLYKIIIEKEGKKYYIFKRIIIEGGNGRKDYFAVNPIITYKGNSYSEAVETTKKLFFND